MKKTVTKIFSTVLVLVMLFGTLTAYAADRDTIYLSNGEKISFAGELEEGSNKLEYPGACERIYATFNAEEDGYYLFEADSEQDYWISCVETNENNQIVHSDNLGAEFSFYDSENEKIYTIIDLKAGEKTLIILWEDEETYEKTVSVSYMGKDITGIDFSAGTDYAVLSDDIYEVWYEFVDAEYQYGFTTNDLEVTFDSGKTVELERTFVMCECETEIKDGVNDIGVYFGKKIFPAQIEVRSITYFVENAEADNPEDFIRYEYYDGAKEFAEYEGGFTVTLKNGEKIKVAEEWETVVIPGTDPKGCWVYADENSQDGTVDICIAGNEFEKYECKVQPVLTEHNFRHMTENVSDIFEKFKWRAEYYYEIMVNADSKADTLRAFGTWISYINNNIIFVLTDIVGEFFDFVTYTVIHPRFLL